MKKGKASSGGKEPITHCQSGNISLAKKCLLEGLGGDWRFGGGGGTVSVEGTSTRGDWIQRCGKSKVAVGLSLSRAEK